MPSSNIVRSRLSDGERKTSAVAGANTSSETRSPVEQGALPYSPIGENAHSCDKVSHAALQMPRIPALTSSEVEDNWPNEVPVTDEEIAVLETYLGRLLDELLITGSSAGSKDR